MTRLITTIVFISSVNKFVQEHEFWGFFSLQLVALFGLNQSKWREGTFNSSWGRNWCYASRL